MFDAKLLELIGTGLLETAYMVAVTALFSYIIGLPTGVVLAVTSPYGIRPNKGINTVLGGVVNVIRSVPFIILLITVIPITRLITGTSIGSAASIVPLTIAAVPVVARSVESSLMGVDRGVVEAAQSIGSTTWQIIRKVLLPEALPSLLSGAASATITVLGNSAMAGVCGGGGLGAIAINYGYYRGEETLMYIIVVILVLIVQGLQKLGEQLSTKNDRRIRNNSSKPIAKEGEEP